MSRVIQSFRGHPVLFQVFTCGANFRCFLDFQNRIIGLEKQERNGEESQAKVSPLFKNKYRGVSRSVWPSVLRVARKTGERHRPLMALSRKSVSGGARISTGATGDEWCGRQRYPQFCSRRFSRRSLSCLRRQRLKKGERNRFPAESYR